MNKASNEPGQTITLPDGRQLGYLIIGKGKPVFWFHGLPASRLEALSLRGIADSKHLQVIGADRPGFGLSTYAPNRTFRDTASDVAFLADKLGIDTFALVGISGGGHYAITCAALLAKRLSRVVVICGLSLPLDPAGMVPIYRIGYRLAPVLLIGTCIIKRDRNTFLRMGKDTDRYMKSRAGRSFLKHLPEDDAKFYTSRSENRDLLMRSTVEAFRQGPDTIRTVIQEAKLIRKGWDVDLSQIPPGLVHIWHGTTDRHILVSNSYKNAKAIPGAHLKIFENEGHLFLLNHLEELGELLSS